MRIITTATAFVTLTLFGATSPALAQLPPKPAPEGMIEVTTGGESGGRILTSRMGGTRSARKMLLALKIVSGEYFDKPFTVTRAFADRKDQNLQAAFTARLNGVPIRGVASVKKQGDGGQGTLLFDSAKTFVPSFRKLTARQNSGGKAAPITLTPHTAPDGNGQISLPPGYQITGAYKGTLDIAGPGGAAMALGAPTLCTSHAAGGLYSGIPAVDFNDPVRALVDYANYTARKAGVRISMKILDTRPVPGWSTGRAALVRYSVEAMGKSMEGFGLFSISVTDANQALFYQSFISAPTATYQAQFPGMLRAWGTWNINPAVFQERLMAAAGSMRGMSDIISGTYATRAQSSARVSEAWSDYIRDQGTWRNPNTGVHYKVSNTLTNGRGIPQIGDVPLQPVPLSDL